MGILTRYSYLVGSPRSSGIGMREREKERDDYYNDKIRTHMYTHTHAHIGRFSNIDQCVCLCAYVYMCVINHPAPLSPSYCCLCFYCTAARLITEGYKENITY